MRAKESGATLSAGGGAIGSGSTTAETPEALVSVVCSSFGVSAGGATLWASGLCSSGSDDSDRGVGGGDCPVIRQNACGSAPNRPDPAERGPEPSMVERTGGDGRGGGDGATAGGGGGAEEPRVRPGGVWGSPRLPPS